VRAIEKKDPGREAGVEAVSLEEEEERYRR
jgi:hypothetical protein